MPSGCELVNKSLLCEALLQEYTHFQVLCLFRNGENVFPKDLLSEAHTLPDSGLKNHKVKM